MHQGPGPRGQKGVVGDLGEDENICFNNPISLGTCWTTMRRGGPGIRGGGSDGDNGIPGVDRNPDENGIPGRDGDDGCKGETGALGMLAIMDPQVRSVA